jgi:hypothetical protein
MRRRFSIQPAGGGGPQAGRPRSGSATRSADQAALAPNFRLGQRAAARSFFISSWTCSTVPAFPQCHPTNSSPRQSKINDRTSLCLGA